MLGDSGASVNVIDEPTLETLVPKPYIKPPDMNLCIRVERESATATWYVYRYNRDGRIQSHNESVRGPRELRDADESLNS